VQISWWIRCSPRLAEMGRPKCPKSFRDPPSVPVYTNGTPRFSQQISITRNSLEIEMQSSHPIEMPLRAYSIPKFWPPQKKRPSCASPRPQNLALGAWRETRTWRRRGEVLDSNTKGTQLNVLQYMFWYSTVDTYYTFLRTRYHNQKN
jgi:hypothetical protein